jgi:hypothetical protein
MSLLARKEPEQDAVLNCTWVCLEESALKQKIVAYLKESYRAGLYVGSELPEGSSVGFVIYDDKHLTALDIAGKKAAESMQSIFITKDSNQDSRADYTLSFDAEIDSVRSLLRATQDFRDEILTLRSDVAKRKSAIGTINYGQFIFKTLDEARSLATMLALACPNSDLIVVWLQELMINAVEHGNLEISASDKQNLLMNGSWREEVERRLQDPEYLDRLVIVSFQRSERMISITIQDEGMGFDHEKMISLEVPSEGYRGRGIAMARDLSFSAVTYMGPGNIVEATILINEDDTIIGI